MKHHFAALLAASLISSVSSQQVRLESVPFPQLDLSSFNNNEIGLLGDFDAISQYKYKGASNFTNQNNLTNNLYYTEGDNDYFISIGEVEGSLTRILPVTSDAFLLLGDFTSIGERYVSAPAIFNTSSNEFRQLDPDNQIDGNVTTALYDDSQNLIYFGGDFTFNDTSSAAFYNVTADTLNSTLFQGFGDDSKVNSIIKVGENIVFGGQFDTLGLPELLSQTYNMSNTSVTTDQLVSLKYASFSSSDDGSSPGAISCPGGDEWTSSSTAATLDIGLPYTVTPSKVRLYNSADDDSQVSLFRLITYPAGSIMNLTYVDPESGEIAFCDAWCPLLDSESIDAALDNSTTDDRVLPYVDTSLGWTTTYQEFGFVNSLDVYGVIFQALDSYGSSVALSGLEIYQSLFSTYANNTLNEPACSASSNYSKVDLTGNWDASSNGQYLISTADVSDDIPDVGVTFYPNITYAGVYSILLYTPGCSTDNTCDYRGIVNVTVFDEATNNILETELIYQTNVDEKYDTLFDGHVENSVRVEVKLYSTVSSGDQDQVVIVADRISTTIYSIDQLVDANGTVGINGIFEYSPANFTKFNAANLTGSELIGNSSINLVGTSLSDDADVSLVYDKGTIYVGGDFESNFGDNFFVINVDQNGSNNSILDANVTSVNGGLNGVVSCMFVVDEGVIILGDFEGTNNDTDVTSLSGDADDLVGAGLYNGSWYSFGSDVESETIFNLTLRGLEFWAFGNESWSVDNSTWFSPSLLLDFNVSTAGKSGDATLFLGSLRIADDLSNKGIMFSNSTFEGSITDSILSNGSFNCGLYINESLSAFGGDFVTKSGTTNLIIKSYNDSTGLDIVWDDGVSVTALFEYGDKLFIGTSGSAASDGDDFDGVLVYNLLNSTFQSVGSLSGTSVIVNEFGYFNHTYLVVAGEFDSAGSQDCSGLCFYNMNETSWAQLIDDFSGTVNTIRFLNNTLVAGGDFEYQGDSLKIFAYDFNSTDQTQPGHFSEVEAEVKKMLLVDNSTAGRMIVSGESFISAFDGSIWYDITDGLNGSMITDIQLLNLATSNSKNNGSYFDASQILLASGNLTLSGYGYANVAFFNSTTWLPYAITTHQRATATVNSIFMNKDMSSLYISGTLTNSTRPRTTSSSIPTATSTTPKKSTSGKMDRGFIVLVGLALAVGTIALLGALGAFFLLRNKKQEYMPLEPRVNETEMLDTVPPENLLKHV